ncbi:hypothetical protein QYM36_006300 [Artemia franciscana]|uniref:Uncharacterized protein n=1 Tax=Artemia franciscana TaxID=6661 RepID=A0AA88HT49_ARTSF|nr:hypothetical protein QYM36_006300 [Artemia franciscana]
MFIREWFIYSIFDFDPLLAALVRKFRYSCFKIYGTYFQNLQENGEDDSDHSDLSDDEIPDLFIPGDAKDTCVLEVIILS